MQRVSDSLRQDRISSKIEKSIQERILCANDIIWIVNPFLLKEEKCLNYITGIMTNREIGVIVITVENKVDRMSPERKRS